MFKGLEEALAKVLRLPEEKQALAAGLLEQLAKPEDVYPLSVRSAPSFVRPWPEPNETAMRRRSRLIPRCAARGVEASPCKSCYQRP
jgi:hypothetical protein